MTTETKDSILYVRLTQHIRNELEAWAERDRRPVSTMAAIIIEDALKAEARLQARRQQAQANGK